MKAAHSVRNKAGSGRRVSFEGQLQAQSLKKKFAMPRKAKGNDQQGWGTRRSPRCCLSGKRWLSSGSITWVARGIEPAPWALPEKDVIRDSCCQLRKAHRGSGACGRGGKRSENCVDRILAAGLATRPASPIRWLARCLACLSSARLLLPPPHMAKKTKGSNSVMVPNPVWGMSSWPC